MENRKPGVTRRDVLQAGVITGLGFVAEAIEPAVRVIPQESKNVTTRRNAFENLLMYGAKIVSGENNPKATQNEICGENYLASGVNRAAYSVAANTGRPMRPEGKFCTPIETEVVNPAYDQGLGIFMVGRFMTLDEIAKWSDHYVDQAKKLNANKISVTIPFRVDGIAATTAYMDDDFGKGTPSLEAMAIFFDKAHAAGLYTSLRFTVDEDHLRETSGRPTTWRGAINPGQAGARRFFENYATNVVLPLADFAREHHVGNLALGVELEALQQYTGEWQELAQKTKARAGETVRLSYDLNFGSIDPENPQNAQTTIENSLRLVQIPEIDEIGLDEYKPVKVPIGNGLFNEDPTVDEMVQALGPHMDKVRQFRDRAGKEIVITETSIRPQTGAILNPWESTLDTSRLNYDLQARYLEAVKKASDGIVSGMDIWGINFHDQIGQAGGPFSILETPTFARIAKLFSGK